MTYDEINSELKMLLCKNKLRNEGDFIFAEYLGDVGIEINASIQIGHIAHMRDTLMKLSDTKSSPIADDGYTGIDIFELDTSGTLRFRLDIHYIAEAMDQIKLFMIAEGVNENEIDFVFQRCEKLSTLGFQSISLT
ncbi:MAG: hypothetical protein FAF03_03350 [Epsilonproteobacteria bacterium]|nr:hypothetical protein [Campylobacterota bacterium]